MIFYYRFPDYGQVPDRDIELPEYPDTIEVS